MFYFSTSLPEKTGLERREASCTSLNLINRKIRSLIFVSAVASLVVNSCRTCFTSFYQLVNQDKDLDAASLLRISVEQLYILYTDCQPSVEVTEVTSFGHDDERYGLMACMGGGPGWRELCLP
jgi:hypothetical protein